MRARLVDADKRWSAEFDFWSPDTLRAGVRLAFRRYRAAFGERSLVVEAGLRARDREDAADLALLRECRSAEWPAEKFAALWPNIETERTLWSRRRWERAWPELAHAALPVHVAGDYRGARAAALWVNCAQHVECARTGRFPGWKPDHLLGPDEHDWQTVFNGLSLADWHVRQLNGFISAVCAEVQNHPLTAARPRLRLVVNHDRNPE